MTVYNSTCQFPLHFLISFSIWKKLVFTVPVRGKLAYCINTCPIKSASISVSSHLTTICTPPQTAPFSKSLHSFYSNNEHTSTNSHCPWPYALIHRLIHSLHPHTKLQTPLHPNQSRILRLALSLTILSQKSRYLTSQRLLYTHISRLPLSSTISTHPETSSIPADGTISSCNLLVCVVSAHSEKSNPSF